MQVQLYQNNCLQMARVLKSYLDVIMGIVSQPTLMKAYIHMFPGHLCKATDHHLCNNRCLNAQLQQETNCSQIIRCAVHLLLLSVILNINQLSLQINRQHSAAFLLPASKAFMQLLHALIHLYPVLRKKGKTQTCKFMAYLLVTITFITICQ